MRYIEKALIVLGLSSSLFANPEGQQVVGGQATFTQQGLTLTIEAAHQSIIYYDSFNIGANETVRFVQPGQDATVLNRVMGAIPSQILGALNANGKVYLVNPQGIYFGKEAIVNTAALIAVAGQFADSSFLKGNHEFSQLTGSIVNEGQIFGDFVCLAGKTVSNFGSIVCPNGACALVAGDYIYVKEENSCIITKIESEERGEPLFLGAGDIYTLAIKNRGSIKAKTVALNGQGIVDVGGSIDVTGDVGGTVHILGEKVGLFGAHIDATGLGNGGEVLIGGDYMGEGDIPISKMAIVDKNSCVDASSDRYGDGGKIIVWSDLYTGVAGVLKVHGGDQSGNGGFMETSSAGSLHVGESARIDAASICGKAGIWLLDPANIEIQDGGDAALTDVATFTVNPGSTQTIAPATINAVSAGTTVTLQAESYILDVDPASAISMNAGCSLIMQAGDDLTLTNIPSISIANGGGTLSFSTNDPGASTPDEEAIIIVPVINALGNFVSLTNNSGIGSITLSGDVTCSGFSSNSNTGTFTCNGLSAAGGQLTITCGDGTLSGTLANSAGGSAINFINSGRLEATQNVTASVFDINFQGSGTFAIDDGVIIQAGGAISGSSNATIGINNNGGTATIESGSNTVNIAGAITNDTVGAGVANLTVTTTSGTQNITLGGPITNLNTLTINAGSSGAIDVSGTVSSINNLTLTNCSSATFNGSLGVSTLTTTANSYSLSFNAGCTITNSVTLLNTGALTFGGTAQTYTFSAGITATAPSQVNLQGNLIATTNNIDLTTLSLTGNGVITASAGTVTLSTITTTGSNSLSVSGTSLTLSDQIGTSGAPLSTFSATGTTNLSNSIYTSGTLTLNSAVTLGAAVTLNSGSGTTTFGSTVDGGFNLSIDCGAATLSSQIGGATQLTNFTLNNTGVAALEGGLISTTGGEIQLNGTADLQSDMTLTSGEVAVSTITSSSPHSLFLNGSSSNQTTGSIGSTGSRLTTFNTSTGTFDLGNSIYTSSTLTINGSTVSLTGNSTLDSGSATTTIANNISGDHTLTINCGALSLSGVGTSTAVASLVVTNSSTATLSGNITTAGGHVLFSGAVSLGATIAVDTTNSGGSAAGAAISLASVAQQTSQSLSLNGGTGGAITASGAITVNNFTLSNCLSATLSGSLTAATLTTTANSYSVSLGGGCTITNATTFNNTSGVNFTASDTYEFLAGVNTGTNAVSAKGTIITDTGEIIMGGALSFPANLTLQSHLNGSGNNIQLATVASSAPSTSPTLAIDASSQGAVTVATCAITSSQPWALTLTNCASATFTGAVNDLSALNTTANPYTISFEGGVNSLSASATINSTGSVTFSNGNTNSWGGYHGGSGTMFLDGTLQTKGISTVPGPITLTGSSTFILGASGASITLSTIDGAFPLSFSNVIAGPTYQINGAIGGNAPPTSLTASEGGAGETFKMNIAANATIAGNISIDSGIALKLGATLAATGSGTVSITGSSLTLTNTSVISTAGQTITIGCPVAGAGFNLTLDPGAASSITVNASSNITNVNNLTVKNAATFNSAVGTTGTNNAVATFTTDISEASNYAVTFADGCQITNAATFTNTGGQTFSGGNTNTFAGGFTSGSGTTTLNGTLTSSSGSISLSGPLSLSGASTINSTTSSVSVTGTTALNNNSLSINANTSLTLGGSVGTTTNGSGGLTLTSGTTMSLQQIGASGTTIAALSATNTGIATLNGNIFTTGGLSFSGAINLGGNTQLNESSTSISIGGATTTQGNNLIAIANTSLTFTGSITTSGDGTVSLTSGTTMSLSNIGYDGTTITPVSSITLSNTGTATLNGGLYSTNALSISGAAIIGMNITLSSASTTVTTAAIELDGSHFTASSGTSMTLGAITAALSPGNGTVSLSTGTTLSLSTVGVSGTRISTLMISNTGLATLGGDIYTGGFIDVTGPVAISATRTIDSSSGNNLFQNTLTGGSNALTLNAGSGNNSLTSFSGITTLTFSGQNNAVSSTGSCTTVQINNSSASTASSFNGALTCTNFNTTSGNHAINLNGGGTIATVNGGTGFTASNAGNLTFNNGATTLTFTNGLTTGTNNISMQGIVATTANTALTLGGPVTLGGTAAINTGTGPVSLQTVDGAQGLTITCGNLALNAAVGGGTPPTSFAVTNSGTVQLGANITVAGITSISGTANLTANVSISATAGTLSLSTVTSSPTAFQLSISSSGGSTLTGAIGTLTSFIASGTTNLSNNITTTGAMTFNNALLLASAVALNSGTGTTSFSTIDGANTLAITTGAVSFNGLVGNGTPPTQLVVTNSGTATVGANIATNGAVNFAGTGGISLGADITTGSGTFMAGSSSSGITLTGSSATRTITTSNQTITINCPVVGGGNSLTLNPGSTGSISTGSGAPITGVGTLKPESFSNFGAAVGTSSSPVATFDFSAAPATATLTFAGGTYITNAVTLTNTAALTFSGGNTNTFVGGISTGTGTIDLNGTLQTTNTALAINNSLMLQGNSVANAGSGSFTCNHIDGAFTLAVTCGIASLNGPIGSLTPPTGFTMTNSGLASISSNITVAGNTSISGASQLTGNIAISATAGTIALHTVTTSGSNSLALSSSGGNTLTGPIGTSGSPLSSFSVTLGTTTLSSNIFTSGALSFSTELMLGGNVVLNAATGAATLTGVDGANTLSVTSGLLSVGAAIGGSTPPTAFTATNSNTATISNNITTAGPINFNGTGALSLGANLNSGVGSLTIGEATTLTAATVTMTATNQSITVNGTIAGGSNNLTLTPGSTGSISFGSGANITSVNTLTVNPNTSATFGGEVGTSGNPVSTFFLPSSTGSLAFNGGALVSGNTTLANSSSLAFGNSQTNTFSGGLTTGAVSTSGTIATNNAVFTMGAVTLTSATNLNSANGLITLASVTGGNQNLSFNAGTGSITVNGTTSSVGNLTLTNCGSALFTGMMTANTFTTTANSYTITFDSGSSVTTSTTFNNTGGITWNATNTFTGGVDTGTNPLTLASGSTITGVTNPVTIGAVSGEGMDLTLMGSTITFQGALGAGIFPLGNVTITNSGSTTVNQAIHTENNLLFNGTGNLLFTIGQNLPFTGTQFTVTRSNVTFSGVTQTYTANGGSLSFGGTIDGNTLGDSPNLIFDATGGTVTVSGAAGSNVAIGSGTGAAITIENGGTAQFSSSLMTNSGISQLSTSHTLSLLGDTTVAAGNTDSTFNGNVTLGEMTFTSDGNLTFGTNSSNEVDILASPATITTAAANKNITFNAKIDGAYDLTVNPGAGIATFNAPVGSVEPIYSLTVGSGGLAQLNNSMTAGGGTFIYNSPVVLGADLTLTDEGDTGIQFNSTVDGAFNLTLSAVSDIILGGAVGSITPLTELIISTANNVTSNSTVAVFALTQNAGSGNSTFNGAVTTQNGINQNSGPVNMTTAGTITFNSDLNTSPTSGSDGNSGGNVTLTTTSGSIVVTNVMTSGSNGTVGGTPGGNAGNITLQPGNLIVLQGNLTALGGIGDGAANGSDGSISLAPAGLSSVPTVATITSKASGNDVVISGGSFTMGHNEVTTVLGNFTLNASGSAVMADTNALNTLTISAPSITIQQHAIGMTLLSNGTLGVNRGAHYVGNTIIFSTAPTTIDTGPDPIFYRVVSNPSEHNLSAFVVVSVAPLISSQFLRGSTVLDSDYTAGGQAGGDVQFKAWLFLAPLYSALTPYTQEDLIHRLEPYWDPLYSQPLEKMRATAVISN